MNSETLRRILNNQRYGSSLIAVSLLSACQPPWTCDMMGTCLQDGEEAGVSTKTSTESDVSATEQNTSSDGTSVETRDDAGSDTSSTSTVSGTEATSSVPNAACVPVSDDGCDGDTPWCIGEDAPPSDGGLQQTLRCVQCEDDTHCQWPYATQEHSGICLGYVCAPCDVATNRGCVGDMPYCVESSALATGDASVGHSEHDGGSRSNAPECVECLTESDCGGDTPACVGHACVACDKDEQCGNAEASRCDLDTNTCVGCNAVGQCAHLSNIPACDVAAGTCVECTREEQTKCGSKVCNLLTEDDSYQTCSEFPAGETTQCYECVSDTQCAEGYRCVLETFKVPSSDAGVEPTGKRYCMALERELLRLKGRNCTTNRPFVGSFEATSVGDETGTYCRPRFTTCSAYLMHGNGPDVIPEGQPGAGDATCLSNDSCGLATVTDGYCVKLPNSEPPTNLCTYECASDLDCDLLPSAVTCGTATLSDGSTRKVCAVTTNPPSGGSEP